MKEKKKEKMKHIQWTSFVMLMSCLLFVIIFSLHETEKSNFLQTISYSEVYIQHSRTIEST